MSRDERRLRFNAQTMAERIVCVNYFGKYLYSTYFNPVIKIDVYVIEGDEPSHDELVEVWSDTRFNKVTNVRIPSYQELDFLIDEIELPEIWLRK